MEYIKYLSDFLQVIEKMETFKNLRVMIWIAFLVFLVKLPEIIAEIANLTVVINGL